MNKVYCFLKWLDYMASTNNPRGHPGAAISHNGTVFKVQRGKDAV